MKLSDYLHKKMTFFFVSLVFILLSVVTASYCLSLNKYDLNKNTNVNLNVEYINGQSNLNVSEYPINNNVGYIYAPENKVKIMNKSEHKVVYDVILETLDSNEIKDLNKIYVSINGSNSFSLAKMNKNIILTKTLDGFTEDIIDVRIWGSKEYITQNDLGKNIALKLKIQEK